MLNKKVIKIEQLSRLIAKNPRDLKAYRELNMLYSSTEEYSKARDLTFHVLNHLQNPVVSFINARTILDNLIKYKNAVIDFGQTLTSKHSHDAIKYFGKALFAGFNHVKDDIQENIQFAGQLRGRLLINLGISSYHLGEFKEAITNIEKGLRLIPADRRPPAAYNILGTYYLMTGDLHKAASAYRKANVITRIMKAMPH
ncbi:tetratricopeptide repeat protein [Candidatus Margulisiibacteriota bacterium]